MRHAGIGWPENAGGEHPDPATILGMPGIRQGCTLICAPSARYWYTACRAASPLVVWRAIPRVGKRPAELGWNPQKVAAECLNLWDEQPHGGAGEWFLPLNELQFEKENGGPFPGYAEMAANLGRLRAELRKRLPGVSLMFPAWVPSDDGTHLDDWRHEAEQWDAICVHCYGSAGAMYERYVSYRNAFPQAPLMVGEWNANHEGHDEHAALEMWAGVSNADPAFLGAIYYIWETRNAGERDLSIWGNDDRLALFQNPPVPAPAPIPEPEPEPMPDFPLPVDDQGNEWKPSPQDIVDGAIVVADEAGLPRDLMLGLCYAECGEGLQSFDRWFTWTSQALDAIARRDQQSIQGILDTIAAAGTNDISFGPCHQTWRWSQEYNGLPYDARSILEFRKLYIQDHGHALRVARDQIARYWARYAPDKVETLSRYNKPDGSALAGVRARYAQMLALARETLGTSEPEPAPPAGDVLFEDYRDPVPAGRFAAQPRGVILHGSRSGNAGNPIDQEYKGTASYEVNNSAGLGWHATIGERKVAVHLTAQEWGWNARAASPAYLAVEFAQPTAAHTITEGQIAAFVAWFKQIVQPAWPGLPLHFPTHAEVERSGETGQIDGKSDCYAYGDIRADQLRSAILAGIQGEQPAPEPEPDQASYDELANLVGVAYHEDGVVIPALVGAQNAGDWGQVDAVVRFLRENNPDAA